MTRFYMTPFVTHWRQYGNANVTMNRNVDFIVDYKLLNDDDDAKAYELKET